MSTFAQIKSNIKIALNDLGIFYTDQDLNDSLIDGYNDVATMTGCIIKKAASQSFLANVTYYDFRSTVPDFTKVLAIFNISSNLWLLDDTSLKDFDKIRENWEVWTGTTRWWAPVNFKYTAVCPKYASAGQTFDLYYSASAPVFADTDTPLIANDMQDLLEFYSVADLAEQQEEFSIAQRYWMGDDNSEGYFQQAEEYKERVQNMAKSDLLFKI